MTGLLKWRSDSKGEGEVGGDLELYRTGEAEKLIIYMSLWRIMQERKN